MTGRLASSGPEPFDACPDGGRCWHACPGATKDGAKGMPCWRVLHALPFSSLGANWTQRDIDKHRRAAGVPVREAQAGPQPPASGPLVARALREAADAARGMHDPPAPDCVEWADWLRARADRLDGGDPS